MTLESRFYLLNALIEKTQAAKISWEDGPLAESFYAKIGQFAVAIRPVRDDFVLVLFNEDGEIVENISDRAFSEEGYDTAYTAMKLLYTQAKRNALGTDKIVMSMIDELKST